MKKLTKHDIEFLIKTLQDGKEIPPDYKYSLFPTTQKEYELVYAGKMRKEDLLANEDGVFPVPLQTEKVFNGNEYEAFKDGWKNMIVFGDNLQFLKTIYENKDPLIKDKVKGKVKLIYIDPPFGTGDEYDGNKGQKGYSAKRKGAEFVEFLRRRLMLAREILSDDGNIFIRIDYHFGHYVKLVADEVFGKENFQNEIIINRFKRQLKNLKQFNHATDSLFFYSKTQSHIFNEIERERLDTFTGEKSEPVWRGMSSPGIRNPQERNIFGKIMFPPKGRHWTFKQDTLDQMVKAQRIRINDKIQYTDTKGNKVRGLPEYLQSERVPIDNLWTDVKGYVFNASYPTENPEELIQRVIQSASNEGDIVFDFFGGSGATMTTAEKLGRKWITGDLGKLAYYTMQKRILRIEDSWNLDEPKKKYGKKAKSFVTAQLGIYDLKKALDLEWQKYQEFVAGLFEIEIKKNKIAGFEFEGKKGNFSVKIFDYQTFKNSTINEKYLKDMHAVVGKKASGRVYIVAPANFVDFLSNYHEIDGVKYYFLKIPYHVIKELHQKPFQKSRQPQSKKNVNDLEDAIGFHFIRHPEVKSELKKDKDGVKILIKSFVSQELESDKSQDEKGMKKFETLSAVFVDKSYNGKTFEMDEAFFADELVPKKTTTKNDSEEDIQAELKKLEKTGLEISFKKAELGKEIMVIYTDVYGNDFTETFTI